MRRLKELAIIGAIIVVVLGGLGLADTNLSKTTETEDRIAALEEQVAILYEEARVHEEHIRTLEWRDEQHVLHLIYGELWHRANTCQDPDMICYYNDPLLAAFYDMGPGYGLQETRRYIFELGDQGYWYGERVSETEWLVSAQYDENTQPLQFLVNSTYGTMCWAGASYCPPRDSEPEY